MSKQVNTADEQDEIQHMDYIYMVNDDKLMIRMNAELDHHLAEEMRQVIDDVIDKRGVTHIVFDFTKVDFMDSAGIGLIMGRYKKVMDNAQLSAAHPASGDGWEMNAIAATVLGGTSMSGGSGTIIGTVVGAFVIGVINDGMTMCGVSEFWQKVIRGLVIILAVVIDQTQRNLQAKMALQARNENK